MPATKKPAQGKAVTIPPPIGRFAMIELASLSPGAGNRETKEDEDLKGLAASIAAVGLLHPLIVRHDLEKSGLYKIVAGERRWRAMRSLKMKSAPCIVLAKDEDPMRAEAMRVVENHQRKDLTPLEEAAAVRGLLETGLEPEAAARCLGRSRSWIARRASLTELSEKWLAAMQEPEGKIREWPPSHLEAIARFPADVQDRILDLHGREWRWSIPAFTELTSVTGRFQMLLSAVPWKLDDATLSPEAGACSACPKRSAHHPDLFEEEMGSGDEKPKAGDRCLDPHCWGAKAAAFLVRKAEELRREHGDKLVLVNADGHGATPQLERLMGATVVNAWETAPAKKGERRARPALVVAGAGFGRLKWIQPAVAPSRARHAGSRTEESDGAEPEEKSNGSAPLSDRRLPYDRRRKQLVIDAIKGKIQALSDVGDLEKASQLEGGSAFIARGLIPKALAFLCAMIGSSGWRNRQVTPWDWPEALAWEKLDGPKSHELGGGEVREAARQTAWDLLRLCLYQFTGRLCVQSGERDNALHYADAERIAGWMKIDLAPLRAEAALAIPYPKSWRAEVVDEWAGPVKPADESKPEADAEDETAGDGAGRAKRASKTAAVAAARRKP